MKRNFFLTSVLALAAMLARPILPISIAQNSADQSSWRHNLSAWRAQRAIELQAPEGWLSLIGLHWLREGDNSFGSAEDSRVQITAKTPKHIGVVRLEKDALRLLPPREGFPHGLLVDGKPAKPQALFADDAGKPSKLTIGGVTILVIHRDDKFALRIKDLQAATRIAFHGLRWFAPNAAYRIQARWIPYASPKILDIPTVLGTTTHLPAPGAAEFTLDGQVVRLEPVLEDPKSTELFFILRDATSKTSTYGSGRFLYTQLPNHGVSQPGKVWLDFNRLVNPPCAFTPYATCPLPPVQNRLSISIPAGEQRYHD
jgi:uncharacterized protein